MLFLLWILNFVISWFNAWGCGKTWNETRAKGGLAHFMNWMGAIMSASGFTWCYLVIMGFAAAYIPCVKDDHGVYVTLLNPPQLQVFFDLGYLVIIGPILGSGLAIMLNSWGYFWRKRTFGSGAVAGYNTFANVYNYYNAARYVPTALDNVLDFFGGSSKSSSSSSSNDGKGKLILIMVVVAAIGGILTTYIIVRTTARNTARDRAFRYPEAA